MNPFTTPDRMFISRRPQDGALYCFVSRDCEKMKMLRFDVNGWCLYYCRLAEGAFRWTHRPDYEDPGLEIDRMTLHLLLVGLDEMANSRDAEASA